MHTSRVVYGNRYREKCRFNFRVRMTNRVIYTSRVRLTCRVMHTSRVIYRNRYREKFGRRGRVPVAVI